jgi:hypothetical protein
MTNAHLRFGWLTYVKMTEKTTTNVRLRLDRFIGEMSPDPPRQARAHLISVVGGDTQISAVSAAISLGERFMVEGPGLAPTRVCLERNAQCLKGAVQLPGRKKPLRHLIGISEEFTNASVSSNTARTLLVDASAEFVWASLARIHGLPGVPEWATWFYGQLERRRAITPALGIGCRPVLIKGDKEEFLLWLGRGIQSGQLTIPVENGPIRWSHSRLSQIFQQHVD